MNIKKLSLISACVSVMIATPLHAQEVVVDDNFAANGTADANLSWFSSSTTSSTGSAVEFNANSVGLVSGGSGRQIHRLFDTQTLEAIGDSITATVTFTTPATVAAGNEDFRIGLFDHDERTSDTQLGRATTYSSSSPNVDYNGLQGFYSELDIESASPGTNVDIRFSSPTTSGRLISTSSGFGSNTASENLGYVILPNTTYTVNFLIERIAGTTNDALQVTTSTVGLTLADGTTVADGSVTESIEINPDEVTPLNFEFGMLAMGSSSGAVGSTNLSNGAIDNGIEISNFSVVSNIGGEILPPPPPAASEQFCYPVTAKNGNTSVVCFDE